MLVISQSNVRKLFKTEVNLNGRIASVELTYIDSAVRQWLQTLLIKGLDFKTNGKV